MRNRSMIRSKRKQIVVNADFSGPQHVRPEICELCFNRCPRRHDDPLHAGRLRQRQRLAIDLAVLGTRKRTRRMICAGTI